MVDMDPLKEQADGRCPWAGSDPRMIRYHDEEWGRPVHEDRILFEFLILEGMQAGLSWATILYKRENFRIAFEGFEPLRVSRFDESKVASLLQDAGIIRNRLKIRAAISNAVHFLEIQHQFGSFDRYLWDFVDGRPIIGHPSTLAQMQTRSELSDRISKEMKGRGFRFVGSTILYSYLQAVGVVDDHIAGCPCGTEARSRN